METAHRVAYELTYGPLADDLEVLHSCDNPPCCNPEHLSPGTHRQNMVDAEKKGRIVHGTRVNTAKLSEEDVLELRRRYTGKHGQQTQLAREFGVHPSVLTRLFQGKIWKHL